MTPEVAKKRLVVLQARDAMWRKHDPDHEPPDPPTKYTCDDCPAAATCNYAFDDYNTDGDCLAEK